MKKLVLIFGALLALAACGGDPSPGKSEGEAVQDVRFEAGISDDVSGAEIRELMREACRVLEDNSPAEVVDRLHEFPPAVVVSVLDNATQAFCPEHRGAVRAYLTDQP